MSLAAISLSLAISSTLLRNLGSMLPKFWIRLRSASTKRLPSTFWFSISTPSSVYILSLGVNASSRSCLLASLSSVLSSCLTSFISLGMLSSLYSIALFLSAVMTCTAGPALAFLAISMLASISRISASSSPPLALTTASCSIIWSGLPALRMSCSCADAFWILADICCWMAPLRADSDSLSSPSAASIRSFSLSRNLMSKRSYDASTADSRVAGSLRTSSMRVS
mmetsp:Transcript_30594/g.77018  ORF Transcript_30594/g.77018 Transcript_30594/m.77018 type:complete len:225 (+) Transcript_30594:529-1203(+)